MPVFFDTLESRCLLHGGPSLAGFGFRLHVPDDPSPAVQADLDKIKTDQAKLKTDTAALKETLKADRQAINDAINALSDQLDPLRTKLKDDAASWRDILAADRAAIRASRQSGDDEQLAADQAKYKADRTAANAAIKADGDAIRNVIDNDPAVKAARDKLTADSKPITDDVAALKADYKQLWTDIKAQKSGDSGDGSATA